ncbi:MAG: TatD family hydrolase [Candidatus Pacearchaeota archaeon]
MKYIDVHAHLESDRFKADLDKVIDRCRENSVSVINSGVNSSTNREVLEMKKKYPDILMVSFGLYPIDALAKELEAHGEAFPRDIENFDVDKELEWIKGNSDECVAIGEIGLDYSFEEIRNSEALRERQKVVFRKILNLAKEIDKPVVIHSRKAEKDAIEILEEEKMKKVVMHCFSGKKSLIKRCIDNGWFLSIPPVITRLEHFKMVVEMTSIEQLLTETDSPYLSPVVVERNEPSNVLVTIKEIARIKGIDEEEVREKLVENVKKLFKID